MEKFVRYREAIREALAEVDAAGIEKIPRTATVHPRGERGGAVGGGGGGGMNSGSLTGSSFDPFKSQSFSKNAQIAGADPTKLHPDMPAGYKGATERELEELRDKKRKLEEKREKEHGGGKLFDRMLKGVRKGEGDD